MFYVQLKKIMTILQTYVSKDSRSSALFVNRECHRKALCRDMTMPPPGWSENYTCCEDADLCNNEIIQDSCKFSKNKKL